MSDARRFIDRYGFSWQVCELWSTVDRSAGDAVAGDAAPTSGGWLYFFSRSTTLVLREYPSSWDEMGWRELERLLERAQLLGSDATVPLTRPPHVTLGTGARAPGPPITSAP